MARTQRKGYTYDARTGFKVKGHKLREDGEMRGVYTTDADPVHPQRYPVTAPPDGQRNRSGIPAPHGIPAEVYIANDGGFTMAIIGTRNGASVEVS